MKKEEEKVIVEDVTLELYNKCLLKLVWKYDKSSNAKKKSVALDTILFLSDKIMIIFLYDQ